MVPRGTGWYFSLPETKGLREIWYVVGRCETKQWWPETGLNRRRRPFQGLLPSFLSGLESAEMIEDKGLISKEI
jgi:hypothetical protein